MLRGWNDRPTTSIPLAVASDGTHVVGLPDAARQRTHVGALPGPQNESRTCISMPGSLPGQVVPTGHGELRHGRSLPVRGAPMLSLGKIELNGEGGHARSPAVRWKGWSATTSPFDT